MIFWLLAIILAMAVSAILAKPLLRPVRPAARRSEYDMAVYRDQLAEIDKDVERGLLSPVQADTARLEVQRRLLAAAAADSADEAAISATASPATMSEAVDSGKSVGSEPALADATAGAEAPAVSPALKSSSDHPHLDRDVSWMRPVATAVVAFVPAASVALYLLVGRPGLPDAPFAERQAQAQAEARDRAASLNEKVGELTEQIAANPTDLGLRMRLGRTLAQAGALREAAEALHDAAAMAPTNPAVLAELGQALVVAEDGMVTPEAHDVFISALRVEPVEPRARFFLGLEQLQNDAPRRALAIWRNLQADTPENAPWATMLSDQIREVAVNSGIPPVSVTPVHPLDLEDGTLSLEGGQTPGAAEGGASSSGAAMRAEADAKRAPGEGFSSEEREMIGGMVDNLAARLRAEPEDYEGWLMLGRSYLVLEQPGKAAEAFQAAASLRPQEILPRQRLARAIMADAQAKGEKDPPEAVFPVMAEIHALDPTDPEGLFFTGLKAARDGDLATARTRWETLLTTLPADSPLRTELEARLQALPQ